MINLEGPKTVIGAAPVERSTAEAMAAAAQGNRAMAPLLEEVGRALAAEACAEAACVTHCSAASIAIAAAAMVSKGAPDIARALPRPPRGVARRIVLQKGHDVDFGASVAQMLRLGGGEPLEVGAVNRCSKEVFAAALADPRVAGALHVFHPDAAAPGLLGIAEVAWACREAQKPLTVDAAGEADWAAPLDAGAAMVLWSAQKEMAGPTAGVIAGEAFWIAACRAQEKGVGRAMKPTKEAVAGLSAALARWRDEGPLGRKERAASKLAALEAALDGGPWMLERVPDPMGKAFARLRLRFHGMLALDAPPPRAALLDAEPALAVGGGDHATRPLLLDARWASDADLERAGAALRAYARRYATIMEQDADERRQA